MSEDIIYERVHFRHDSKWSGCLGSAEGGGRLLCVACVIEMLENDDLSFVRKSFALSSINGVLRTFPGVLRELLQQDLRVSVRFTTSLLGLLQTVEDPAILEKVDQALVMLLSELQSDLSFRLVLDHVHEQLNEHLSVKGLMPTFNFLGSLVEALPIVAHSLVTQYVPILEHLCAALLYPDEGLKGSVLYVWLKLFGTAGGLAAQPLPIAIRDRVCILLLQTFANASSPQLINNCIGLLWLLVQRGDAVSVLMNSSGKQMGCDEKQSIHINNSQTFSQNQEQQSTDHCHLPLILKKLLLSGDDAFQVTSAKCIASVLLHSPSQYSAPFIRADIPEFLFDRLASASNEVLLWSVYSCLVLLVENPLFFSQCHAVYGIESLVRSLKEALQMTNLDVPKQGLLLLTEILERQPPGVHLFPSGPGFAAVSEALVAGVSSSCLLVATQAASAGSALLRIQHQSTPVQYREIQGLVEAITNRFSELPLPSSARRRSCGPKKSDPSSLASRSGGFLLQALVCFQAACRLAEECAAEPALKENAFTAPAKRGSATDSLEALCHCLLRCCDSAWIPAVARMCECVPNPQVLQCFYSILCAQFSLLPSHMSVFASKIASSGFYRLALEHKGLLCAENRNPNLNASCCGFLLKLSMCLLTQSEPASGDAEVVENLLQSNLPSLCCRLSDWPSLLCQAPGLQLCHYKGPRATQYCLLILVHLALQQGDRLLPDHIVFSSVLWLLRSLQEEGGSTPPTVVLRSALYLLAVTQDGSSRLEGAPLSCISKALASCQSFCSIYTHHPALLHFIWRHPELAEKFGPLVLELWLTKRVRSPAADLTLTEQQDSLERRDRSCAEGSHEQGADTEIKALLSLSKNYPDVTLTLLEMVCNKECSLAERALAVLEADLRGRRDREADLCSRLCPALLRALQRLRVENMGPGLGQVNSLPLVLRLLCVTHTSDPPSSISGSTDGVHLKLLYHVSNIAGRVKPANTETLLPSLSYLYCCLSLSPAHCADRAVSMLLSNGGLMEQLQTLLSSSALSPPPSAGPPSALLCCGHLLLSSLITVQRVHSAQVHKSISWSLDTAVQRILVQKRHTDNLLLVSYLRLLEALLDVDLASAVVRANGGPGLAGAAPLEVEDGALYPLGRRGARCLSTALSGLILQKHELLLRASVNCLSSLLCFLDRKSPATAKHVVCQPWNRFLLSCLLSSGDTFILHPAVLGLFTLLIQHGSAAVHWDPDLLQVMDTVERRGVKELSWQAAQALGQLLTQIQSGVALPALAEEHRRRVECVMESLRPQLQKESTNAGPPSNVLCVRDVCICLSDFSVKADRRGSTLM